MAWPVVWLQTCAKLYRTVLITSLISWESFLTVFELVEVPLEKTPPASIIDILLHDRIGKVVISTTDLLICKSICAARFERGRSCMRVTTQIQQVETRSVGSKVVGECECYSDFDSVNQGFTFVMRSYSALPSCQNLSHVRVIRVIFPARKHYVQPWDGWSYFSFRRKRCLSTGSFVQWQLHSIISGEIRLFSTKLVFFVHLQYHWKLFINWLRLDTVSLLMGIASRRDKSKTRIGMSCWLWLLVVGETRSNKELICHS